MTGQSRRPLRDDTKTSNASPVPAGQEAAVKPAAAPKAANEGDATNPQTDRAAAGTEVKPEQSGSDKPALPAAPSPDKPTAGSSTPSPDAADSKPADTSPDAADSKPADTSPDAADSKPADTSPDAADTATDWEARAAAAEEELANLKLKVSAQNAAAEAGLPPEAAQFLHGDNDEEIKAAAETLASLIAPASPLDRNPVPRGQAPADRPDLATIGARLFRN